MSLKWLYQEHVNNLLLNYPQTQSRSIHALTDNINLDVKIFMIYHKMAASH